MRGSDSGELAYGPGAPATREQAPERVFKAPLLHQLTEGVWGFVLAAVLPGIAMLGGLIYELMKGDSRAVEVLVKVAPMVLAAGAPLLASLFKGMRPTVGGTSKCAWIALGDGYIRVGMSFLRSKVLFDQIVDVERGWIDAKRQWRPADETHSIEAAPASASGPNKPAQAGKLTMAPERNAERIRIRFVMRRSWDVVALAYPEFIDPAGELTSQLELAARHTRAKLGVEENAPDDEVSLVFSAISARYQAEKAADEPDPYALDIDERILPPGRSWSVPDVTPPTALPPASTPDTVEWVEDYRHGFDAGTEANYDTLPEPGFDREYEQDYDPDGFSFKDGPPRA
ncbi:MAG TPA: hypothetical protein QGH10_08360 [Armatimonadota bacterium]|nr:hypothetical protein [Armatimonadota bacterium]